MQQQQQPPENVEMKKAESPTTTTEVKSEADSGAKLDQEKKESQPNPASDIKSMEKLVNGLNGSSASKFGISHNNNDQQISA